MNTKSDLSLPGKLTVQGEATIQIPPDTASTVIGVRSENRELAPAQGENATIIANVTRALMENGVKKEDIQTISYKIEALYQYDEGKQVFRGYRVTHLLKVKLKDISKAGVIIDESTKNGANEVYGVEFSLSQEKQYYEKALQSSIQNAWNKARKLADAAGVHLSAVPVEINEISSPPSPITPMVKAFSEGTQLEPGVISVRAAVTVHYEILK
ncbi:SIMPL domain-containing protein [Bacillus massilinigeriensis]|uniref:SIMPL domain-containing protein n=1 Tax=Bacillus mediterraneensis TaxID=1805474 RepID=UPI0008F816F3|nr:SIMPL domain-containing protein [Bacillus mediterraneensis]